MERCSRKVNKQARIMTSYGSFTVTWGPSPAMRSLNRSEMDYDNFDLDGA